MKNWLETITIINISRICEGCHKFQCVDPFEPKNENHCKFPNEFIVGARNGAIIEKPKFIDTSGIVMKCKKKQASFDHMAR